MFVFFFCFFFQNVKISCFWNHCFKSDASCYIMLLKIQLECFICIINAQNNIGSSYEPLLYNNPKLAGHFVLFCLDLFAAFVFVIFVLFCFVLFVWLFLFCLFVCLLGCLLVCFLIFNIYANNMLLRESLFTKHIGFRHMSCLDRVDLGEMPSLVSEITGAVRVLKKLATNSWGPCTIKTLNRRANNPAPHLTGAL